MAYAVVHQGYIRPNFGAQFLTGLPVFFGNTPCMQRDRAGSTVDALVGNIEKLRRVPEGDRTGIDWNTVSGPVDDFMERQASELGVEISEGDVDRAERIEGSSSTRSIFPDLPPRMLLQQGILADEGPRNRRSIRSTMIAPWRPMLRR